jgi:membrane protease YdiL (CAAX protease family)
MGKLIGKPPTRREFWSGLKLTAFTFIFSYAAIYMVFYPLTYISEPFVIYWLIDLPPIIYFEDFRWELIPGPLQVPFAPNLLSFLSVCVIAPITEEVAIRGLLLHRWAAKWGIWPAVLATSGLFGIVHPDVLGAFVFGVAMSILYLKTQSLVLVIACHAANNIVCWIMELAYYMESDFTFVYTLESFYGEWGYGVFGLVICAVWAVSYLKGEKSDQAWKLPVT